MKDKEELIKNKFKFLMLYIITLITLFGDQFAYSQSPKLVSETVRFVLREKARGVYCDGDYKRFKPEFVFVLDIKTDLETKKKTMKWSKIGKYGKSSFSDVNQDFFTLVNDRPSFISIKPERTQKKESVFVGQTGVGTVETFLIGKDYFEYTKVGMGQVSLSSGSLTRVNPTSENLTKYLK